MNMKSVLVACVLGGILSACAQDDRAVFVTSSSIGINADSVSHSASFAYDRIEGFFAPIYPGGVIPPVVASIESGGGIFDPQIRQVYATGNAAWYATRKPSDDPEGIAVRPMTARNSNAVAFFGTSTTFGAKVAFGEVTPIDFVLGFRRKEASVLPIRGEGQREDKRPADIYPSVFASFDSITNTSGDQTLDIDLEQFFATGIAAEALASESGVRDAFRSVAQEAAEGRLSGLRESRIKRAVTDANTIDQTALASLIARSDLEDTRKTTLLEQKTIGAFMSEIRSRPSDIESLHDALTGTDPI